MSIFTGWLWSHSEFWFWSRWQLRLWRHWQFWCCCWWWRVLPLYWVSFCMVRICCVLRVSKIFCLALKIKESPLFTERKKLDQKHPFGKIFSRSSKSYIRRTFATSYPKYYGMLTFCHRTKKEGILSAPKIGRGRRRRRRRRKEMKRQNSMQNSACFSRCVKPFVFL